MCFTYIIIKSYLQKYIQHMHVKVFIDTVYFTYICSHCTKHIWRISYSTSPDVFGSETQYYNLENVQYSKFLVI